MQEHWMRDETHERAVRRIIRNTAGVGKRQPIAVEFISKEAMSSPGKIATEVAAGILDLIRTDSRLRQDRQKHGDEIEKPRIGAHLMGNDDGSALLYVYDDDAVGHVLDQFEDLPRATGIKGDMSTPQIIMNIHSNAHRLVDDEKSTAFLRKIFGSTHTLFDIDTAQSEHNRVR